MNNTYSFRKDFTFNKKDLTMSNDFLIKKNKNYHNIYFNNIKKVSILEAKIVEVVTFYLKKLKLNDKFHVFIVGLGNEENTADSVGPKTIKKVHANGFLEQMEIVPKIKITALEPGVLGTTGIDTKRIVESVVDEIHPDVVILIDSFVTDNVDLLNHIIHINNKGIAPGSGIKGLNYPINKDTIGTPVIVIGVPTALEIRLKSKKKERTIPFILSLNNIDDFVNDISTIIANSLNKSFY